MCCGVFFFLIYSLCFLFSCFTILSFHLLFWYGIPLLFSAMWGEILAPLQQI